MTVESLRALGLGRFQLDVGHPDFFRGLMEEVKTDAGRERELRTALASKDRSTLERLVAENAQPEPVRSEEHMSELQSRLRLVCRLLLEKKKKKNRLTLSIIR